MGKLILTKMTVLSTTCQHRNDRMAYCALQNSTSCPGRQWVLRKWKTNAQEIPSWADAAKKALLVQPSSVASERVFSLHAQGKF